MRKYYHILINPKITTGDKYNELVRKYPLPNQLKIDFVYNVKEPIVKEVTRELFNLL